LQSQIAHGGAWRRRAVFIPLFDHTPIRHQTSLIYLFIPLFES